MQHPTIPLRHALTWPELWPSIRNTLCALALFVAGVFVARNYASPIQGLLADYAAIGVGIFIASSVLAVLLPLLSNLPLVPAAVVAWGPWWTAGLLLLGWIIGAALAFTVGRHGRAHTLRHFPSVQRHADIDRLIHPRHRLLSLILLRMTFPVDVLSYSLGLFSRSTTLGENVLSTMIGAAPFALLFALLPTLSATAQLTIFGGSVLAFLAYASWVWRGPSGTE
jgi:uncharacterized membrane protein YdjX (TVP38/TMEM64 family)